MGDPKAITNENLAKEGWQFVDNSGDGGSFGFHYKPCGVFAALLSAGGYNFGDDFLYPVTRYDESSTMPVCLVIAYLDRVPTTGAFMMVSLIAPNVPTDAAVWQDGVSEEANRHEMFFTDVGSALDFVKWLETRV